MKNCLLSAAAQLHRPLSWLCFQMYALLLLQFGGMDARIAAAGFLDADGFALPVELREVVQPQAAAEPTREGIEPGVGEELQHEIPALEDHPAGVPENDSEAQPFIEGGGGIEIS
ncbi:hypothetical protein HMPREF1064_05167 [Phocaeicola dorei CL02T12C06]|uniref:Uncharacterized protein n=2 Tax=Pseudomonadati TaxID=3379134 RepID=I9EVZ6_9BACT|nr:hypothetical protein HMPREF1064_05167 [Phocaeicola dorei CL02T12C06]